MSLSVLNEDADVSDDYRKRMDRAWLPVRVLIAAREQHGQDVVLPLYTAIGRRIHPGGEDDYAAAVAAGLAELGLPEELIDAGESDSYDELLRASHADGMDRVGKDVGTPVIAVGDIAFFGPVVTPAPKGDMAAQLWDGVLAVASVPGFYELKRTRNERPAFD
jgi:hypothetical protein